MAQHTDAQTQDLLTKNVKDLLWLNRFAGGKEVTIDDALAALKKQGSASDGAHSSNLTAILQELAAADPAKKKEN